MTRHQLASAGFLAVASLFALGVQLSAVPVEAASATGQIAIQRGASGHFVTTGMIDGAPVEFMVDTGATLVALTARDARRAGLAPHSLIYDRIAVSPAGAVAVATVRLRELRIGELTLNDIEAAVTQSEDGHSLLGLNALAALERVEIKGDTLTLTR